MPEGINSTVSEGSGGLSWPLAHLGHTFLWCWWAMMDRLMAQVFYWLYYQAHVAYSTTWVPIPSTPYRQSHSCLSDGNPGMLIPSCIPRRKTHECRQEGDKVLQQAPYRWETWPAGSPAEHTLPGAHSTAQHAATGESCTPELQNPQQPYTHPCTCSLSCSHSTDSKMLISKTHYLKTKPKKFPQI